MENPYIPLAMRIEEIIVETEDENIKTFELSFMDRADEERFVYTPGQFAELSVFGKGEAPFGMASTPTRPGRLSFSVSKIGVVTGALHRMEKGDVVGVRGPLGNGYPLETFKGKNLVLVGGGFGFSTLRSLTNFILHDSNRKDYSDLTVIYGARRPGLLLYKKDLEAWKKQGDIRLHLTVDKGENGWQGHVGFVPDVTRSVAPNPKNACAVVCGPPAMIQFTLPMLKELGFRDESVFLSLEMRMKCGIGKCGRCNVGSKYICSDGPVFSQAELAGLTAESHF
ncbi:MAG: heterodisulfide reductase subunit F [Desulfobacteraceae bacterium]|nr:MAG: heterodisulfide reductase subunit F [Desulfobacteraceae bacterium]